jgi:hypothetical protein
LIADITRRGALPRRFLETLETETIEMRRLNRDSSPREIVVKYSAACAETGKPLPAGAAAVYYPRTKKLFHPESKTAAEFRSQAAAAAFCLADANY